MSGDRGGYFRFMITSLTAPPPPADLFGQEEGGAPRFRDCRGELHDVADLAVDLGC